MATDCRRYSPLPTSLRERFARPSATATFPQGKAICANRTCYFLPST